jgi:hypothetical protein
MKKLIYGGLFLALVGVGIFACQKENVVPNPSFNTIDNVESSGRQEIGGKKGSIACTVLDSNGKPICAGTRCGTPLGNCGKNFTNCHCIETGPVQPADPLVAGEKLIDGMTKHQFIQKWNTEEGRKELISKGFYEKDVQ